MNESTALNPHINATAINPALGAETALNPMAAAGTRTVPAGTLLADKYEISSPLNVSTGEADLYLCLYEGKEYVAKIYRRKRAVKPEVVTALKAIDSPYIAPLFDTGVHGDLPFEVLPYYKNGSLQGRKFTLEELRQNIIPCINEALHVLHENDIIHKDLKPSNIMLADDGKNIAIIDFGISSVVEAGNTVLLTQTGMTPEYSAPETFRSLFLEESDYYSFGVTLFELFCGYTPYANMDAEQIARFTAVQRIPFPEDMPEELKKLISALTYYDITNRNKKENPNRRWTYEEVRAWCEGKEQVLPGEGTGAPNDGSIPPYPFRGKEYTDIPTLACALAANWNEGKKQLYRGLLSGFFRGVRPDITRICMKAEEEATQTAGKDDIIFWGMLYSINPEMNAFYWMGQTYESLPALGRDMLEKLWKNNKTNHSYWDSILHARLLSAYLEKTKANNAELAEATAALEAAHALSGKSKRDIMLNYYTMAYLLSGQKLLNVGEKQLKNVAELTAYMKSLLDSSYAEFEEFCHSMIDYDDTLDVQLEAWLIALGKRKEMEAWRISLRE